MAVLLRSPRYARLNIRLWSHVHILIQVHSTLKYTDDRVPGRSFTDTAPVPNGWTKSISRLDYSHRSSAAMQLHSLAHISERLGSLRNSQVGANGAPHRPVSSYPFWSKIENMVTFPRRDTWHHSRPLESFGAILGVSDMS